MRKLSTAEFVLKAKEKHGNIYDYSSVVYNKAIEKVTVTCKKHGNFEITPNQHLNGGGCAFCGREKTTKASTYTHEQFLIRLQELHNGAIPFNIDSVSTAEASTLELSDEFGKYIMTRRALLKGSFPSVHSAINKTSNTINRFRKKHKDKYNYDKFIYVAAQEKATLTCPLHGDFLLSADTHLQGVGCKECGNKTRIQNQTHSREEFVNLANKKHSSFYTYENVTYNKSHIKVVVTCPLHGDFPVTPANHLKLRGCPVCRYEKTSVINGEKSTGWSLSRWQKGGNISKFFDSFKVYFVKAYDKQECFYKIGRTYCTVDNRFESIPYFYDVILITSHDDPKIIFDLENHLKRTFKAHKYKPLKPFGGQHECFKFDDPTIQSVLREMQITSSSNIIPTSTK